MDIEILYTEEQILEKVKALAVEIEKYYIGKDLTVITLLNGGMVFASDLIRQLHLPLWQDSFAISSYENNQSTGKVRVRSNIKLEVRGRHVLIIDDVLETGTTLRECSLIFQNMGA